MQRDVRQKRNTPGMSIGSSSVLTIFVVLLLTTFAMLTLLTANADYKLTEKVASATEAFYVADSLGEEAFYALQTAVQDKDMAAVEQSDFTLQKSTTSILASKTIPVDAQRVLHIEINIPLNAGALTGTLQKTRWQTQPISS